MEPDWKNLTEEELWQLYNQLDDGYIEHNQILGAWYELQQRGLIQKEEK